MSKLQKSFLLLLVVHSLSGYAFEFNLQVAKGTLGKIVEGAKKGIEKELEKEAERKRQEKILEEQRRKEQLESEQRKAKETERLNSKTENSKFIVKQSFADNQTFALLKISKDAAVEDVIVEIKNKAIDKTIYLREGAGAYTVKIYASTNQNPYGGSYTYVSEFNLTNSDNRDLKFLLPSDEVQSDDSEIMRIAESLITNDMTDLEKVKAAHNFVAERIDYDTEGYRTGNYVNNPTDAVYVLQKGVTVCAGYSALYAAIVRAMGIRAAVIHGKAFVNNKWEDHAWNEVFVNGKWNIVDVTWDDMNDIRFDYFFPTEENFSKDHQREKAVKAY